MVVVAGGGRSPLRTRAISGGPSPVHSPLSRPWSGSEPKSTLAVRAPPRWPGRQLDCGPGVCGHGSARTFAFAIAGRGVERGRAHPAGRSSGRPPLRPVSQSGRPPRVMAGLIAGGADHRRRVLTSLRIDPKLTANVAVLRPRNLGVPLAGIRSPLRLATSPLPTVCRPARKRRTSIYLKKIVGLGSPPNDGEV